MSKLVCRPARADCCAGRRCFRQKFLFVVEGRGKLSKFLAENSHGQGPCPAHEDARLDNGL